MTAQVHTPVRVLVIGAGTAGSIVAAELSRSPHISVVLLEAGADRVTEPPANLFEAIARPGSTWPELSYEIGGTFSTYTRGRGLGGSSAVNGAMATRPDLPGFNEWVIASGDDFWGPAAVNTEFDRLVGGLATPTQAEWGRADRALANAASSLAGCRVTPVQLALDPLHKARRNPGSVLLTEARNRPNLTVMTDTEVEGLLVARTGVAEPTVSGVRLRDGREIVGDHTVLCAGVVGSPALLLRSGIGGPAVGANLQNHTAIFTTWDFAQPRAGSGMVTSIRAVVSDGSDELEMIPFNVSGVDGAGLRYGGFLTTPVGESASRGRVVIASDGTATVTLAVSGEERRRLGTALLWAVRLAVAAVEANDAVAAFVDDAGTPADHFLSSERAELEEWAIMHPAPMYHATGTCRMGMVSDPNAVVDARCSVIGTDGVSVIDASVFPALPAVGPNLTVAMLASKASRRLSEHLLLGRGAA